MTERLDSDCSSLLAELGLMPSRPLQALGQYDPARQAVVIFDDIENSPSDAYVPTFIFEFPDNDS